MAADFNNAWSRRETSLPKVSVPLELNRCAELYKIVLLCFLIDCSHIWTKEFCWKFLLFSPSLNIVNLRPWDIVKVRGSSPATFPIYGWKEGGRWNSRSLQRPRTSDADIVLEHTIPVFRIVASFFCPALPPIVVWSFTLPTQFSAFFKLHTS